MHTAREFIQTGTELRSGGYSVFFFQKHPDHGEGEHHVSCLDHRCTGCHDTNRTTWPRLQSLSGFQVGPCEEEEGNGQQRPPVFYLDIFSRKRQGDGAAGITTQIPILLKCHVP